MFLSIYQNNLQMPIISYQEKLFLPRIYSANLGDTILHFVNKKEIPFSKEILDYTEQELEELHSLLFETVHILSQNLHLQTNVNAFTNFRGLPILKEKKKNTTQKNSKSLFEIHYEYEPSIGFIQVYDISTIEQAIIAELIEYQKFVECSVLPPLKICPQCQTCFTSKRFDAIFCSQNCVEKNFKKEKKKDVYYKKYRSLQQYYNKKMNYWCQTNPSFAETYKKQYALWQTLAKREYNKLPNLSKEEKPDVAAFVKKLKAFWTIATVKTKPQKS